MLLIFSMLLIMQIGAPWATLEYLHQANQDLLGSPEHYVAAVTRGITVSI